MREPEGTEAVTTDVSLSTPTVRIFDAERHGAFHDVAAETFPLSHYVTADGSVRVVTTVMLSRFRFACFDAAGDLVTKGYTATDWP